MYDASNLPRYWKRFTQSVTVNRKTSRNSFIFTLASKSGQEARLDEISSACCKLNWFIALMLFDAFLFKEWTAMLILNPVFDVRCIEVFNMLISFETETLRSFDCQHRDFIKRVDCNLHLLITRFYWNLHFVFRRFISNFEHNITCTCFPSWRWRIIDEIFLYFIKKWRFQI